MIVEAAPAKLNLALHVRARRPDGYHELETLFAFAADGDVVTVAPAPAWGFQIVGPFAAGLVTGTDNLVTRAAVAFAARFDLRTDVAVTLQKNLPVASGIGGGSADAAAMLRALARLHDVSTDDPRLVRCAEQLGSDVPACLMGRTALAGGRGERLRPITGLAGTPVLLVNPGVALSTAAVFSAWDQIDRGALPSGDAAQIARKGRNDLTTAATSLAPMIANVLATLSAQAEATLVRMSGSGATCFALYADAVARDRAAAAITRDRPDWWSLSTVLA